MARKGALLERAGALTPRDRMWKAMRSLGQDAHGFSLAEIWFLANQGAPHPIALTTVDSYIRGLVAAKPAYLLLVDRERPAARPRGELFRYHLVRDVGIDAPNVARDGSETEPAKGNTAMWNAMRQIRQFSPAELAHAASTEEHAISTGVARNYVGWLARAGYLTETAAAHSTQPARYRFNAAKNTGPRAPLVLRDKSVYDANTGEIVWKRNTGHNTK